MNPTNLRGTWPPVDKETAVDLKALLEALEDAEGYHGYGITNHWIEEDCVREIKRKCTCDDCGECLACQGGYEPRGATLYFTVERGAMDGNGGREGTEIFTGAMPIAWWGDDIASVFPFTLQIFEIETPPRTTYTREQAEEYLDYFDENWRNGWAEEELTDDNVIDEACHFGMSDGGYFPPDTDFFYQELDHHLRMLVEDIRRKANKAYLDNGRAAVYEVSTRNSLDGGEKGWSKPRKIVCIDGRVVETILKFVAGKLWTLWPHKTGRLDVRFYPEGNPRLKSDITIVHPEKKKEE